MRLKILLAAAVMLAPVTATATLAARWYRVTQGTTGTWYIDMNSIKQNGQWTSARQMQVTFEVDPQNGDKAAWSDTDFDCQARTVRYMHFASIDAKDAELFSADLPDQGKIHPIEPKSVVGVIADFVCNVSRSEAVAVAEPLTDTPPRP